jgi:hypothetical protein
MKQRYRAVLIAISLLWLAAAPAWADGSVSFQSDILPMIKARPEFEKFLLGTFKITDAGFGTRISDQAMPHLGGARMGPYAFPATWHGVGGDVPITLVVDTDIKFFDRAGREIKNGRLKQAVSMKEAFGSIEIESRR